MNTRRRLKKNKGKLLERIRKFEDAEGTTECYTRIAKIKRRIIAINCLCDELTKIEDTKHQLTDKSRKTNKEQALSVKAYMLEVEKKYCGGYDEIPYKYGLGEEYLQRFNNRYKKWQKK